MTPTTESRPALVGLVRVSTQKQADSGLRLNGQLAALDQLVKAIAEARRSGTGVSQSMKPSCRGRRRHRTPDGTGPPGQAV